MFGKKQTEETCRKKRLSLINRTYEDLHGKEKSEQIKNKLRIIKNKLSPESLKKLEKTFR